MPNSMNVQMILQRANNSYKNKIKKNKKKIKKKIKKVKNCQLIITNKKKFSF